MIYQHVGVAFEGLRQEDGKAVFSCEVPTELNVFLKRMTGDAELILRDGRIISSEQQRKVYALIGEIADYIDGMKNAQTIEQTKKFMKLNFIAKSMEDTEKHLFSLSNCDMTLAREFITYIIDFIIENDIPTRFPLIEKSEDIGRYIYACLMNKKCAVCGRPAHLHHVDTVGANGGDRAHINHIGLRCLPLCPTHHEEIHRKGNEFMTAYHLEPVKIDKDIAKVYGLNTKSKREKSE